MNRLRDPSRRTVGVLLVTFFAAGCSGEDALRGSPPDPKPSGRAMVSATPSSYPYTDCDGLRSGDALDFRDLVCAPENVSELTAMDCISGTYVHLMRAEGGGLEGIVGQTPTWLQASPIDARYGRTPWAFENCLEHE